MNFYKLNKMKILTVNSDYLKIAQFSIYFSFIFESEITQRSQN